MQDIEYLKSMCPSGIRILQGYVTEACDRLNYKSSPMYGEYPDHVMINRLCDTICDTVITSEGAERIRGMWNVSEHDEAVMETAELKKDMKRLDVNFFTRDDDPMMEQKQNIENVPVENIGSAEILTTEESLEEQSVPNSQNEFLGYRGSVMNPSGVIMETQEMGGREPEFSGSGRMGGRPNMGLGPGRPLMRNNPGRLSMGPGPERPPMGPGPERLPMGPGPVRPSSGPNQDRPSVGGPGPVRSPRPLKPTPPPPRLPQPPRPALPPPGSPRPPGPTPPPPKPPRPPKPTPPPPGSPQPPRLTPPPPRSPQPPRPTPPPSRPPQPPRLVPTPPPPKLPQPPGSTPPPPRPPQPPRSTPPPPRLPQPPRPTPPPPPRLPRPQPPRPTPPPPKPPTSSRPMPPKPVPSPKPGDRPSWLKDTVKVLPLDEIFHGRYARGLCALQEQQRYY